MICFVLAASNCHQKLWMKNAASDSCAQSGNIPCARYRNMSVNLGKESPPQNVLLACQSLAAARAKNPAAWIVWGRWWLGWGRGGGVEKEGLSESPDLGFYLLFNSKPNPTSKWLEGLLLLKIPLNATPSSSEPAVKVKQMAFID